MKRITLINSWAIVKLIKWNFILVYIIQKWKTYTVLIKMKINRTSTFMKIKYSIIIKIKMLNNRNHIKKKLIKII